MTLTVGSLFAGIGGFDLAARWMGWRTIWVSEIDAYASKVLAKHFPDAPNLGDITTIDWSQHERPDIICGGFPCQDVSAAGLGAGVIRGTRSGLWYEYARAIDRLRPRYVVVENVGALLVRGMDVVLGSLAALGYDAEWEVLSAQDVGAPHLRDRVWIVAYPRSDRIQGLGKGTDFGRARTEGLRRWWPSGQADMRSVFTAPFERGESWPQPLLRGVDDGLPDWAHRLKGLGNAIVPQCAIAGPFRRIAELEGLIP